VISLSSEESKAIKKKKVSLSGRAARRSGYAPLLLLGLMMFLVNPAPAQNAFSVQLDLKITGAVDLRTYGAPFSFAKHLLADTTAAILKTESQQFKTLTKIDSSFQTVRIRRVLLDEDWEQSAVFSMQDYIQFKLRQDNLKLWRDKCLENVQRQEAAAGGEGITIEIPFKIKSKTFNKIFGGDRVRLRISGNINIQGGFRREGRSQVATVTGQSTDYSFHIDQTQQFRITGEIGDKVTVDVDQNSERTFEFENSLKLTYTGYEDEIIQKIEAGNISMQLQGATLATFSGQNKGLFGLKTDLKVGALSLTGIASLEKGQKNKLTITGGAQQTMQTIDAIQPLENKYFFLDRTFREQYKYFTTSMIHAADPSGRAVAANSYYLYKKYTLGSTTLPPGLVHAYAIYDSSENPAFWTIPPDTVEQWVADSILTDRNYQPGFYLLVDQSQYYIDPLTGYIRLSFALGESDVLAIAYKTTLNETYGALTTPLADSTYILKLLRPPNPLATDDTWPLAWRNVYSLGGVNVESEGFSMKIVYQPSGASEMESIEYQGEQTTFLTLFGLDSRNETGQPPPDGKVDNNPALLNYSYGEVIFPDLQPFDPEGYYYTTGEEAEYSSSLPDSLRIPSIYDSNTVYSSNFKIKAQFKSVSATYALGFNVLEGSEEVLLGGRKLLKGEDYVIDYYSGTLTILNEAALSPSANLEILYESGELFQLDKKTLLGVRGEYALWDQSFIGATALYLNERPLQDRVKVGSEPLRNFLWDLNTRLVFKPNFLTQAVDRLPLIETEAPSQFTVEMEYAQVHPNPNSLDNPATGDPDGVAYVDDFESIKRTTPLGVMRRQWYMASYPTGSGLGKKLGRFVWFNPFDQVAIEEIWPNRPTNSNVAQRTHVLSFSFVPGSPDSAYVPNKEPEYAQSWGGVMRALSAGYFNQTKSKYIEIMLKVGESGSNDYDVPGTLHIDLGQISEDVIPDNALNTEDKNLPGLPSGNGFLDDDEDVGLDGVAGTDPSDHWNSPGNPISNDDWSYNPSNPYDVWKINGTEGNKNDEGGRYPDTEDLDDDGSLNTINGFYRYTLDLSETQVDPSFGLNPGGEWHPTSRFLISPPNDHHWKLYRIPIDAGVAIGSPNLEQIQYARVWVDGFEDSTTYEISIATLEIVGNEWESVPIITPADNSYERVSVEIINTYDNPLYTPPPGVAGYRDPITDIVSQEQSLLLRVNDLPRDTAGLVVRRLFETQDYLEYRRLKMFVHGGSIVNEEIFDQREIWMFFRFGADTTHNYYEYRQRVWPGWDERNNIEIELDQLTQLKLDRPNAAEIFSSVISGSDTLSVLGNPSLSQVRQFCAGIIPRDGDVRAEDGLQVWLDELRVSEVKKEIGRSARASANLTLADLLTLNGNLAASDGNFHNINTRVGSRANSYQGNATAALQVHKILDPKWGLSIPVSGNYSQSESVPYYFPNSDILINENDSEQVDSIKTQSRGFGGGIDISKNTPSASPWLKYSVDRLSGGYDYSRQESSNPTTLFSHQTSHTANLGYNLTFGRPSFAFLSWLKGVPMLRKYSGSKVYYLLTKLNLALSGTESISNSRLRSGVAQGSHTFFLTKRLDSGWHPFESLTFDFNRTHKADLLMNPDNPKDLNNILQGDLGWAEDVDVDQAVTASYTPRLLSWLDTDTRYNTSYHWNFGQGYIESGRTISNNTTMSATGTLKLTQIFKKPEGSDAGASGRPGERDMGSEMEPGAGEGKAQAEPDELQMPPLEPVPGDTTRPDTTQLDSTRLDTSRVDTTTRELLEIERTGRKGAIGDFWYGVRYTITRLRDIRVEYSQTNSWSDQLVKGQAGLGYQLGLNSGDYSKIDSAQFYNGISARNRSDDYKVRSGLDFTKNFKISLNYSYRWSRNEATSINGNISQSQLYFFKMGGDSIDVFEIPIPEWSITWSGWEKFPTFEKIAETVSLEHIFVGSKTTSWQDQRDNVTKHDYSRNFSPLLGVNMTFKKGITGSIRYSWSETGSVVMIPTPSKTRTRQTSLQISASYSLKTGFRIPIPVWPFKNKRFKNNTTFALAFNMSGNTSENEAGGEFVETNFSKNWSIKPSMDYTFSNTVTGGLHFEYGSNKSKTGDSNYQEFGLRVNITIRG
jgi:hypothetical protein